MSSYDSRFEQELQKLIAKKIAWLLEHLEVGTAITDHAKYREYVGRLAALREVAGEFCDEVKSTIDKG